MEHCDLAAKAMKGPVVVSKDGENLVIDDDENEFLSLGPKFCIFNYLDEEEYANNLEQAILKYKWDKMGEDKKNGKEKDPADDAINAVLDDDEI